jgi:hypothetical protein
MIDWIRLLTDYRVNVATHGKEVSHGWIGIFCYKCNDRSRTKLGINLSSGGCSCWSCGKIAPLDVIENTLRIPREEARRIYRKYVNPNITRVFDKKRTKGSATKLAIHN